MPQSSRSSSSNINLDPWTEDSMISDSDTIPVIQKSFVVGPDNSCCSWAPGKKQHHPVGEGTILFDLWLWVWCTSSVVLLLVKNSSSCWISRRCSGGVMIPTQEPVQESSSVSTSIILILQQAFLLIYDCECCWCGAPVLVLIHSSSSCGGRLRCRCRGGGVIHTSTTMPNQLYHIYTSHHSISMVINSWSSIRSSSSNIEHCYCYCWVFPCCCLLLMVGEEQRRRECW